MFYGATAFNQDISTWNVSSVTDMNSMFRGATSFNNRGQPLNWDNKLQNVKSMNSMFYDAKAFNQDIRNWEISNVTDMEYMFYGATSFNKNISSWKTKLNKAVRVYNMFQNASSFCIKNAPIPNNFKKKNNIHHQPFYQSYFSSNTSCTATPECIGGIRGGYMSEYKTNTNKCIDQTTKKDCPSSSYCIWTGN